MLVVAAARLLLGEHEDHAAALLALSASTLATSEVLDHLHDDLLADVLGHLTAANRQQTSTLSPASKKSWRA